MAKQFLQTDNIGDVSEGYVGKAIDAKLAEIYKDIEDRGTDGQTRSLKIELKFKQVDKDHVEITAVVDSKVPAHKPIKTMAKLDAKAGGFNYSPDVANNPEQKTFRDMANETGE